MLALNLYWYSTEVLIVFAVSIFNYPNLQTLVRNFVFVNGGKRQKHMILFN